MGKDTEQDLRIELLKKELELLKLKQEQKSINQETKTTTNENEEIKKVKTSFPMWLRALTITVPLLIAFIPVTLKVLDMIDDRIPKGSFEEYITEERSSDIESSKPEEDSGDVDVSISDDGEKRIQGYTKLQSYEQVNLDDIDGGVLLSDIL